MLRFLPLAADMREGILTDSRLVHPRAAMFIPHSGKALHQSSRHFSNVSESSFHISGK